MSRTASAATGGAGGAAGGSAVVTGIGTAAASAATDSAVIELVEGMAEVDGCTRSGGGESTTSCPCGP